MEQIFNVIANLPKQSSISTHLICMIINILTEPINSLQNRHVLSIWKNSRIINAQICYISSPINIFFWIIFIHTLCALSQIYGKVCHQIMEESTFGCGVLGIFYRGIIGLPILGIMFSLFLRLFFICPIFSFYQTFIQVKLMSVLPVIPSNDKGGISL